jgi:2-oxoglutarate/2-oxoacid ferredoxin oxidoreductase subunit beta
MNDIMPKCWDEKTKPHLFCPGCGHGTTLKHLGFVVDEMAIKDKVTFGIDIGCSLLAWNFFDFDTVQTHHGRTTSVMVGYKKVKPKRIAIAYMGDGGGYAIGLQALLHAAYRNEPITAIIVNNEDYAMTGGQMSPTTQVGVVTTTSPLGREERFGSGLFGPELVRNIAHKDAFIARGSISNTVQLQNLFKKAINHQVENKVFSFIEVLSICPTNWRTNAKDSFARLKEMENYYPLGEVK